MEELLEDFVAHIASFQEDDDVIMGIMGFLRQNINVFSIGLRIKDGEDFPYYTTFGFSDQFLKVENFLCCRDNCGKIQRDSNGKPKLACVCGAIINKSSDISALPVYTGRSFFTNSVDDLLNQTNGDVGVSTRGTCVKTGYKTLAMIAVPYENENIGLLHLADFEPNKITEETIKSLEKVCEVIGCIIGAEIHKKKKKLASLLQIKDAIQNLTLDAQKLSESLAKRKSLEEELPITQ